MASAATPSCSCLSCGALQTPPVQTLRVLAGVLSAPRGVGAQRRRAIRKTWLHWPEVGTRLIACFAIGSHGLSWRSRRAIDAPDVMWLHDVEEIGVLSIPKVFAWWREAARSIHLFSHAVKLDDDSFLHVPNLLVDLKNATMRTRAEICYGGLAHAGYNPAIFRMCGWTWQRSEGPWRRMQCGKRGMVRPFPFPLGAIQLLSSRLVRVIGTSKEVTIFANAANASLDLRSRDSNEDVALGYWLSRLAPRLGLNVSYIAINSRAANLGCFRNAGLYKQPRRDAVVIHYVKGARGMHYLWGMLHDGNEHDPINCVKDAGIEVPRGSFIYHRKFEEMVRAGQATLSFDQKANRIQMTFGPQRPPHAFLTAAKSAAMNGPPSHSHLAVSRQPVGGAAAASGVPVMCTGAANSCVRTPSRTPPEVQIPL